MVRVTGEVINVNNLDNFMVEVGLLGKRELVERRAGVLSLISQWGSREVLSVNGKIKRNLY